MKSRMVMNDVIHGKVWLLQRVFTKKMGHLIFPSWFLMGRSRNWPDLKPYRYKNPEYTACKYLWAYHIRKLSKRSAIYSGSNTVSKLEKSYAMSGYTNWPGDLTIKDKSMHTICKIHEGKVMLNFAALRTTVYPLSTKNLAGGCLPQSVREIVKQTTWIPEPKRPAPIYSSSTSLWAISGNKSQPRYHWQP